MSELKTGLIVDFKFAFGKDSKIPRFKYLEGETKLEVLGILCFINSHLSPKTSARFDYSIKTQKKLLDYIFRLEEDKSPYVFLYKLLEDKHIIFNRPANLLGMTEVINSNLVNDVTDSKISNVMLKNVLAYYLCLNTETNKLKSKTNDNESDAEILNLSLISFNEYLENIDPIHTLYRGAKLFEWMKNSQYGKNFEDYITAISSLSISDYILEIASMYFSNHSKNDEFQFFFQLEESKQLFESFSERELPLQERFEMEFMHVRKSPFYKLSNTEFLLLDNKFLLEKCYELLIWDFLFEKVLDGVENQQERKNKIKEYKGVVGKYFESHIKEKIEKSFSFLQHPKPKTFDDLVYEGEELSDLYIRHNKKVLIGEVKSSSINSTSKYGENLQHLYSNDRERFFKTHGLNQLANQTKEFLNNPKKFDSDINLSKKYSIYPVLITHEKILKVGLFPQIFKEEFDKLIADIVTENEIKSLMIIHVNDLEFLEEFFRTKKVEIFNFLNNHRKKYKVITKLEMSYGNMAPQHPKYVTSSIFSLLERLKN